MAHYDVTHSCGHTERVALFGPTNTREWRISQMEQELCPECAQIERDKESAKAALEAKEMGLPALTGSEKQVGWAERLRADFIRRTPEMFNNKPSFEVRNLMGRYVEYPVEAFIDAALQHDAASWWINNRNGLWMGPFIQEVMKEAEKRANKENVDKAAINEMMVRPETITEPDTVTVAYDGHNVSVSADRRNEKLVAIVKALSYSWNTDKGAWLLGINVTTGSAADRMTEVSCRLLAAGFKLLVSDENVRQKIVNADYEPVYPRWVSKYGDELIISWGKDDDLYRRARQLPGAHWGLGGMLVNPKSYRVIRDFIRSYDFRVSAGAEGMLSQQEEAEKAALIVKPTIKKAPAPKANGVADLMKSGDEIIPDLRDDD